jgi:hypothetical protein
MDEIFGPGKISVMIGGDIGDEIGFIVEPCFLPGDTQVWIRHLCSLKFLSLDQFAPIHFNV